MPTFNKNTIIFNEKDWLAGLHPQFGQNLNSLQKGGNYIAYSRAIDPYRYLGYVSPGYASAEVTNDNLVNAVLRNGVANGTSAYIIGESAKIHKATNLTTAPALTTDANWPHAIAHGAHTTIVGNDCVLYNSKFYYSFSDNTDWDVGQLTFPNTFDDSFMTATATTPLAAPYITGGKGFPHPLIVGVDDIMYIGDRNFLHAYDWSTGVFSANVLQLPVNYIITSMAKIEPRSLAIFAYFSNDGTSNSDKVYLGNSKCYLWDYLSLDPFKIVDLDDNQVTEAFEYQGTIGCFTSGRMYDFTNFTKYSKMKLYNGSIFQEKFIYSGEPPIRGGVVVNGEEIRWMCSEGSVPGQIYSWGNHLKQPMVLNKIGEMGGSDNDRSGMYRNFSSYSYMHSTGTSSTGLLMYSGTNYDYQAQITTSLLDLEFPFRKQGKIKYVDVQFGKYSSGGLAINMYLKDRVGTNTQIISSLSTIDSSNIRMHIEEDINGNKLPLFDGLRLLISYSQVGAITDCPIVSKVEVEFETINI